MIQVRSWPPDEMSLRVVPYSGAHHCSVSFVKGVLMYYYAAMIHRVLLLKVCMQYSAEVCAISLFVIACHALFY